MRTLDHPERILFLIGLSFALILTACGSAPQAPEQATQSAIGEPAAATEPPATAQAVESGIHVYAPAPAGSTIITLGWEITIVEVLRGEAALAKLEAASPFNHAPDDPGLEWIVLRIHAVRAGDAGDGMRIAKAFFSSAGSDETEYDRPKITEISNPEPELDAVLQQGEEAEGWITVFAPLGDPGLMLVIQPYLYDGDTGFSTGEDDRRFLLIGQ